MLRIFTVRRSISTTCVGYAKARRGHGGVKPTKRVNTPSPAPAPAFKSINRVTKEKTKPVVFDENHVQLKWKEYIDSKKRIDHESIIKEVLEKIIGFSEYSKIQTLEDNLWTLLKKQVVVYDNIAGPKDDDDDEESVGFQYPNDIKDGILECRDAEDYDNMVRLYDYYFQLLTKSPIMHQIENRDELVRIHGEARDEDTARIVNIGGLVGELETSLRVNARGIAEDAVRIWESGIIKRIEEEWYGISEPRNLKMYHNGYGRFVKVLKNVKRFKFDGKFLDDYCRDLMKSEMKFEYEELEIMVRNIIRFQKFDLAMYNKLNDIIRKEMGLMITPDLYKVFLESSLSNESYEMFGMILDDFHTRDGFLIDRDMFRMLMEYYSKIGDAEKLLKVLRLLVIDFKLPLFTEDYRVVIESLIRCGMRSVGVDVVKSLLIIRSGVEEVPSREAYANDMESLRGLEDGMLDLNMMASVNSGSCESVMVKPVVDGSLLCGLLVTCESYGEYEQLVGEVYDGSVTELSAELVKVELLVKDQFGVYSGDEEGYQAFQGSIARALERLSVEEVGVFVSDSEVVEVVVRVVERLVECGVVEGDAVAESMGVLYQPRSHSNSEGSLACLRQQSRDRVSATLRALLSVCAITLL